MGSRGSADIGGQKYAITGETPWKYDGPMNAGHQTEHDELFASIRAGKPINDGDRMVKSTPAPHPARGDAGKDEVPVAPCLPGCFTAGLRPSLAASAGRRD